MNILKRTVIICVLLAAVACNRVADAGAGEPQARPFALPEIPFVIQDVEGRVAYMCEHFWDNLSPQDTVLLRNDAQFEEFFAMYLSMLGQQPPAVAAGSVTAFLGKMGGNDEWNALVQHMAAKYLYHVESPMLDEERYIPFARYALGRPGISIGDSVLYTHRLEVACKNRPGSVANDFGFVTSGGKQSTLHAEIDRLTLLFFNDPECENCAAAKQMLAGNALLKELVENGTLKVVLVYTEGDADVWKNHKNDHPSGWLSVFDAGETVRMKRIYELRAMPSLYLINKNKKVVLKDVMADVLLQYLAPMGL